MGSRRLEPRADVALGHGDLRTEGVSGGERFDHRRRHVMTEPTMAVLEQSVARDVERADAVVVVLTHDKTLIDIPRRAFLPGQADLLGALLLREWSRSATPQRTKPTARPSS